MPLSDLSDEPVSHNDGRMVFLTEQGLTNLLNASQSPNALSLKKMLLLTTKKPIRGLFDFVEVHHPEFVEELSRPSLRQWINLTLKEQGLEPGHGLKEGWGNDDLRNEPQQVSKQRDHVVPLNQFVIIEEIIEFLGTATMMDETHKSSSLL